VPNPIHLVLTVGRWNNVDFHDFLKEFAQSQSHQSVAANHPIGFARRPLRIVVSYRR